MQPEPHRYPIAKQPSGVESASQTKDRNDNIIRQPFVHSKEHKLARI
jgi:hypothetical protein